MVLNTTLSIKDPEPPELLVAQYPAGKVCGPLTKLVAAKFTVPLLHTPSGPAVAEVMIGNAFTFNARVEVAVQTPFVPVTVNV
jgi:hypothetical protein